MYLSARVAGEMQLHKNEKKDLCEVGAGEAFAQPSKGLFEFL